MGFSLFGGSKKSTTPVQQSQEISDADKEKEEAKKKARLLETEEKNKGALIQQNQGQSLRKVFGA